MTEPAAEEEVLLLLDSAWKPADDEADPPPEVIKGAWVKTGEGELGRFFPNPQYRPSSPDTPLDPLDGVLRKLARDEGEAEDLADALRVSTLTIALDDEGAALVETAPDGASAVLVASSPGHEKHATAARWCEVSLGELAAALPAAGVDVLINPGSPVFMRFYADMIREIVREDEAAQPLSAVSMAVDNSIRER
jgi:hypothetical protein